MLKILLRKQMAEVFRSYLYDAKKNRARSGASTVLLFLLFAVMMVGALGGMFTALSLSLRPMVEAGYAWFYFALIGLLSLVLGAFGGIFSTYSSLYLAKDNDLLLSMPIRVRDIMLSRLLSVYLMGALYSAVVTVPAVVVYFLTVPFTVSGLVCALVWLLLISLIVLALSCLLGYAVARLSVKLKRKSLATTILSLVGVGLYYFLYFKAVDLVENMIANVVVYGEKIRGAAYGIYLFGRSAAGDWAALAIIAAAVLALCALTWLLLRRSFLQIATATGTAGKTAYTEKAARLRSVSSALLSRELGRFTASSGYMLNCGLGTLMLVLAGVLLLVRGGSFSAVLPDVFGARSGILPVLLCAAICMVTSMNDMAAPSVALEGKHLWIAKSLPLSPWQILRSKLTMQLLLTAIPVLFCSLCAVTALPLGGAERLFVILLPLLYTVFSACLGLTMGLQNPNLNWTREIYPIKQSLAVTVALLGGWAYALTLGGLYLWQGWKLGSLPYLAIFSAATLAAAALLYLWLRKRGTAAWERL